MQHVLAQALAEIQSAWRFRWYGAGLAWLLCVLGWGVAAWLPNVYEANARVYFDTSSVLRPILSNQIIPADVDAQLSYVRQALLGREYLTRVAHENGLDVDAVTDAELDGVVNKLRAAINVSVSQDARNSIYNISYRHRERDTAVGVVGTLLNSLVEDTLDANREGTDTAERFLDDRILEYESRLQRAEQALANFQRENSGRLPGSQGGYFQRMQAQQEALDEAQKTLRLAESRRGQLRAQLNSESPVMPVGAAAQTEPPPNSIDARIRDQRARLDQLLLEYTERHPDVMGTREALERLERQRSEQLRALGAGNTDRELSALDSNPVHQALQIALNETEVEIATLRADIDDRTQRLGELQTMIDDVPQVEAELARLNRDYDVVYDQYQSLIRSRETQELSRKASDTDQIGFRVINPPLAGFDPVAPPRLLLLTAVLMLAFGAGGGLCWLLAQVRPVFTSASSLREICGLPVLGVVGYASTSSQEHLRQLGFVGFAGTVAALIALFCIAVLVEVVGPGIHTLASGV